MPSERAAKCFADMLAAIKLIETWTAQVGDIASMLHQDALVRSAVERQILVLSEAPIRLDNIDPALAPGLAPGIDWSGIRGIGNFIRHKYDDLDTPLIADVLVNRLVELRLACESGLLRLANEGGS
jgi:uncharacterized protein with HEPN domain